MAEACSNWTSVSKIRDGRPPDLSGIPDFFFFYFHGKKKTMSVASYLFFLIREKNGGMMRYYCRPATHPDLILISRFFSTNLEVFRVPDCTCENPSFLFCFEVGKTKSRGASFPSQYGFPYSRLFAPSGFRIHKIIENYRWRFGRKKNERKKKFFWLIIFIFFWPIICFGF